MTISDLIASLGYDPASPHFKDTPARWTRALEEFRFTGDDNVKNILSVDFEEPYKGMVLVRNVSFTSICPHHLLPYMGVAHVAYLPNGKVVGISKLARLVEHYTHRIVVQESTTKSIVDALREYVNPVGAIAMLTALHTCMSARGIRAEGAETRTVDLFGAFMENAHGCRDEFYSLVGIK